MKGYYVFAPLEAGCAGPFSGVEKKVRSQCKALSLYGDVELFVLPITEKTGFWNKIKTRIPYFPVSSREWKYAGEYDGADFIYIRQVRHDYPFVKYLKAIKKHNPNIKIIYEIPTYPYETEGKVTFKNCHLTIKDRVNRRKLKKYVDRIVTFYDQDAIFGIPTIRLKNGFDFSTLQLNQKAPLTDALHLIEVSTTAFWHGYDRLIEGMHRYYQNGGTVNVVFHMVGDPLQTHREMVQTYGLQDHVIFHGRQSGAELDAIYEQCLLGVDVLGGHRKDYPISSSLKSREYAAKGLPIITSSPVDYLEEDYLYQLILSYDDCPIDVQAIIAFAQRCFEDKSIQQVREEIRSYAEQRCDMSQTMLPVVDFLQNK